MTENPMIFDLAEALNRSMDDADFLHMMMDEFQTTLPDLIGNIEAALNDGNLEEMGKQSHQLKGAAANLGAKAIAAIALELEKMGKVHTAEGAPQALKQLKTAAADIASMLATIDWVSLEKK